MIPVVEVYNDCRDILSPEENGNFPYSLFNSFAWDAQLRLMDWISGSMEGNIPPEPYLSQKNRDWLSPFVVKAALQSKDSIVTRPADFYQLEHMYILGASLQANCENGKEYEDDPGNIPVSIVDSKQFDMYVRSHVRELRPSSSFVVAKAIDKGYYFAPSDPGPVGMEYIRYPKKAFINTKIDPVFNEEVPDTFENFEWDEKSRGVLKWFICDLFFNKNREQSGKQFNQATAKTVRG